MNTNIKEQQLLKKYLNDKLLRDRCNEITRMLLGKMSIDTISNLVKDFQLKYIYIKEGGEDYTAFNVAMWAKLSNNFKVKE